MENQSSEEEDQFQIFNLHSSYNFIHNKKQLFSIENENKNNRKRSSSMSLNYINNFVPKLKPIQTKICPSPINLNRKSPSKNIESLDNNKKIYSSIFEVKKDFNLKTIKFRKKNKKKSIKFLNIEEEAYETEAKSDIEDKSRKITLIALDSESSRSDLDDKNIEKRKKNDILKNINIIREKMILIRKNSIYNEKIFDDSNIIRQSFAKQGLNQNKNLYQQRNNKNLNSNPLKSFKYRTKSMNVKQRYVSTILGFLEKNNSNNSFYSNWK